MNNVTRVSSLDIGRAAEDEVIEFRKLANDILESRDTEARQLFLKEFRSEAESVANATGTAVAMISVFLYRLPESDCHRVKVMALLLAAFNLQLMSFKLFMSGYTVASGGLLRQAIEGLSLAVVCSAKGATCVQKFDKGKYGAKDAVRDLVKLSKKAHVNAKSARTISDQYHFYHGYAHLTKLTIAATANISRGGTPQLGSFFDPHKLPQYRREVRSRVSFARLLANVTKGVCKSLALWS